MKGFGIYLLFVILAYWLGIAGSTIDAKLQIALYSIDLYGAAAWVFWRQGLWLRGHMRKYYECKD